MTDENSRAKLLNVPGNSSVLSAGVGRRQQTTYDLLITGGHVIDARNNVDAVRDVAIKDGKIAAVAANVPPAQAAKTVDARAQCVTLGLVDIHVDVSPGPDAHTLVQSQNSYVMPKRSTRGVTMPTT